MRRVRSMVVGVMLAASSHIVIADNRFPPYHVERTKILMTGEPAPGITGCTVSFMLAPQIDGAGKVLIDGSVSGPGVTGANDGAVWYGDGNAVSLVVREGDPAPGISGAFISEPWEVYVSETGVLSLACYLTGPSINPTINARAAFVGTLGNLQKIVQAGDPAPFTEPGTVFASGTFAAVRLSDNGSILLIYDLAGPAINSTNDRAMYVGYPEAPELIWRRGMQAPGCEPGVLFSGVSGIVFNTANQIAFRCTLTGAGVTNANNNGYWSGGTGQLQLLARKGSQAPDLPEGVNFFNNAFPGINAGGTAAFWGSLSGAGVTQLNDQAIWIAPNAQPAVMLRQGDPAPEMPPGIYTTTVSVSNGTPINVGSSRVDLQACKLEYSIVSPK